MKEEEPKEKSWKDRLGDVLWEADPPSAEALPEALHLDAAATTPTRISHTLESQLTDPGVSTGSEGLDLASIYRDSGIEDQQFATPEQVLELRNTFADLPAEAQRQKVLKTLASFKVDVAKVAYNTQRKISAIEQYVTGIRPECAATIDTSNQTIQEMQLQVDACRKRILDTQKLLDGVSREGQAAIGKLQGTLDFLGVPAPPVEAAMPIKG